MIIVKEIGLSYPYNKLYVTATVQIFCQCQQLNSLLPTPCMQIDKTNLNVIQMFTYFHICKLRKLVLLLHFLKRNKMITVFKVARETFRPICFILLSNTF